MNAAESCGSLMLFIAVTLLLLASEVVAHPGTADPLKVGAAQV
jgi:hypothetical protein